MLLIVSGSIKGCELEKNYKLPFNLPVRRAYLASPGIW